MTLSAGALLVPLDVLFFMLTETSVYYWHGKSIRPKWRTYYVPGAGV